MKTRAFEKKDLPELQAWSQARGLAPFQADCLSETGLIVDGVAAGFVFLTNGSVAILDAYLSNPEAPREERSKALEQITADLLTLARTSGYRVAKCDTQLLVIASLARKFNFKEMGEYLSFAREI